MTIISRKLLRREDGYEVWHEMFRLDFDVVEISDGDRPEETQAVVDELEDASGRIGEHDVCYTPDGGYLGSEKTAKFLCIEKGIRPEPLDGHNVCSIGFCEKEQKWYGWSHRAIYGFGVGAEVRKGDCAYQPKDKQDFREDCIRFWKDDSKVEVLAVEDRDEEGNLGILTSWRYGNDVPNEKLHGKISGIFTPYPDSWGAGEWRANTLEDAKRMAIAFAEGVS